MLLTLSSAVPQARPHAMRSSPKAPRAGRTSCARSAFTLIELLVVIAIIAILAAILFPVFAQARGKARQASCLSNEKQIAVGVMMYVQDYDEQLPTAYSDNWDATIAEYDGNKSATRTWVMSVYPYTKNWAIARCPSEDRDPFGIWFGSTANIKWWGNWERWPTYGINYMFLNSRGGPGCAGSSTTGASSVYGPGATIAAIKKPAETVLMVDAKVLGDDVGGYYTSFKSGAPAIADPSFGICYFSNAGWGTGSSGDDPTLKQVTYTGDVALRHNNGTNVAFCDGHVKWMSPGALAAGTDWKVGATNTAVKITDINQYLWDLN